METDSFVRFRLLVHYDGSAYHGWQLQPRVETVQGCIEAALSRISGGIRRPVTGSGRTDRGVHAMGQVAIADLPSGWTPLRLLRALEGTLPRDIWIQEVSVVPSAFHPRFDARARTYEYRVGTEPVARSPFHRRWCWPLRSTVDSALLERAAAMLPGHHSFRAFARSGQEDRGEFCTVTDAAWERWEEVGLRFRIRADRFLHHMVRYLVGTMIDIGRGARPPEDLAALLEGRGEGPLRTSPPAPPEGLFLMRVEYPAEALEGDAAPMPTATHPHSAETERS